MIKDNLLVLDGFGSIEEMLGAYMEGNLSVSESEYVSNLLDHNQYLSDLVSDVNDTQIDMNDNIIVDDMLDFELPQLIDNQTLDLEECEYAFDTAEVNSCIDDFSDLIDLKNQDNIIEDSDSFVDNNSFINEDSAVDNSELDLN